MIKYPSKDSSDNEECNEDSDITKRNPLARSPHTKGESFDARTYLFPIDESDEFFDPFSDLSLFLAKRIKREILKEKNPKKWSNRIQSLLLREILPDFTKKFPRYRLGNTALKQTWEKVNYYLMTVQQEQGALQPNGKLNIEFLIKKNLSQLSSSQAHQPIHPYNTAHSLAVKISECIAAHDGIRPGLEDLTKTIWAVQKHLLIKQGHESPSPFEKYDQLDKLIVRLQLEATAKEPHLSKSELSKVVVKRISNLKQLERIRNIEDLTASLSAILANKLYPTLKLHKSVSRDDLNSLTTFITKQITKTKQETTLFCHRERLQLTSRIMFLYQLSLHIPTDQIEKALESAVSYVYSLSTDTFAPHGPVLRQEVYNFIDSEIALHKQRRTPNPLDAVLDTLVHIFNEISSLPKIPEDRMREVEVLIWKVMHDSSDLIEKIPNYLRDAITDELSNIHIDHPKDSFQHIIQTALHFLRKVREIDISDLDSKVHYWTLQNDMIAHFLHFDAKDPLLKIIKKTWESNNLDEYIVHHDDFIEQVLGALIKANPTLAGWIPALKRRVNIMYKYFWYNRLAQDHETSYDRFLKWHFNALHHSKQRQFSEIQLNNLKDLTERLAPLTPFDHSFANLLVKAFEASAAS